MASASTTYADDVGSKEGDDAMLIIIHKHGAMVLAVHALSLLVIAFCFAWPLEIAEARMLP